MQDYTVIQLSLVLHCSRLQTLFLSQRGFMVSFLSVLCHNCQVEPKLSWRVELECSVHGRELGALGHSQEAWGLRYLECFLSSPNSLLGFLIWSSGRDTSLGIKWILFKTIHTLQWGQPIWENISHCSCFDQICKGLKGRRIYLAHGIGGYSPVCWGKAWQNSGACPGFLTSGQTRRQTAGMLALSWLLFSPLYSFHGMVLPWFSMGPPSSDKSLWKCPQRHTQRNSKMVKNHFLHMPDNLSSINREWTLTSTHAALTDTAYMQNNKN